MFACSGATQHTLPRPTPARRPENMLRRADATAHFPGPKSPTEHAQGQERTLATDRAGATALYPPSSATADANRRSRQGRSAGDISAFYHEANVAITTILLEHYLCMQRAQAPRSNRPPSLPAATPANVLRAPEAFARTATNACMK